MPRKPVDACHVRRTEIQKAHVWSKVQVKTSIWICHNITEWAYGVAIESFAALLLPEIPSQDNRTSHRSSHGLMVNTENHCDNDGQ
jgi:hypothetical protein